MSPAGNTDSKASRILEKTNKPILFLAGLAVVLYILELFSAIPQELRIPFLWLNFLIDFIFLIDLGAKCIILGRSYLKSPWFFIDFISTLPVISSTLELLGSLGPQLQVTRVARAARIARIARVARLAKVARVARLVTAIRARQGLTFLKTTENDETPLFNKALLIAVPLLLAAFVLANAYITRQEVSRLKDQLHFRLDLVESQQDLDNIEAEYAINPLTPPNEIMQFSSPMTDGGFVSLSLSKAFVRANKVAGVLLLLVMFTVGLSVFISNSLSKDRNDGKERSILSQCFSPAIVDKFYASPEVVERYYKHWMTVFFIDIRGFTEATEKSDDVEGLAIKLRRVMDTARNEIVESHEGIVDKFMGDAVMGWVGGHFSTHWEIHQELREKLKIDEIDLINQDLKKIQREIKNQKKRNANEKELQELDSVLKDAEREKSELIAEQQNALKQNPDLQTTHEEVHREYQKNVAQSAVSCCLRITQAVRKIQEKDAFQRLKMGVGSGKVLVGNFGSTDQIAFTVLGPTVNRSARLEPASAQVGCDILVDKYTFELLKDCEEFRFRRVPRISLKGIADNIVAYEPFFSHQIQKEFLESFDRGVVAMEKEEYAKAMEYFKEANDLRKDGDPASRIWSGLAQECLEKGAAFDAKTIDNKG